MCFAVCLFCFNFVFVYGHQGADSQQENKANVICQERWITDMGPEDILTSLKYGFFKGFLPRFIK